MQMHVINNSSLITVLEKSDLVKCHKLLSNLDILVKQCRRRQLLFYLAITQITSFLSSINTCTQYCIDEPLTIGVLFKPYKFHSYSIVPHLGPGI